MKQFYSSVFALTIACFGTLVYGAESKPTESILVEEVPEAVREKYSLAPEEQAAQRAAAQKASAEFESAAKTTETKKPTLR